MSVEHEVDPEEEEFIKQTFETLDEIMKRLDSIEELLGVHE